MLEDYILGSFDKPRDEGRIDEFLSLLGKLWHTCPDMRFGQLIMDIGLNDFFQEDEVALEKMELWSEYGEC